MRLRCFASLILCGLLPLWGQFFRGVEPTSRTATKVFHYEVYAVGWADRTHTPLWSAMEVKAAGEPVLGCVRPREFAADPGQDPVIVHRDYGARDEDGQNYSRGHLTPHAIVAYTYGCEASATTFRTSNIVPQLQDHNGGIWEGLESAVGGKNRGAHGFLKGLAQKVPQVWVYTGPVFWGARSEIRHLGAKGIWVPTALWKTVIWKDGLGHLRTCSWMIPHVKGLPKSGYMDYVVTIQEIRRKTGVAILAEEDDPLATQSDPEAFRAAADL